MAAALTVPSSIVDGLPEGTPIVDFSHVSIGFEAHQVLTDISFSVARGETRIILGPAGCGDVIEGLTKPLFSGFIIATVGCYFGLNTTGGTQGVGRATTQAVVFSSVFIIVIDFLVSRAMIGIFGR